MATMLSPGVSSEIIDASQIVPTVGNSTTIFCGNFSKGNVNYYNLITSVEELIDNYGKPNKKNRNDWYQAYNFLRYSNTLLIARAGNINGSKTDTLATLLEIGVSAEQTSTVLNDDVTNLSDENVQVVDEIPENPNTDTIYLVTGEDDGTGAKSATSEVTEVIADYKVIRVSKPQNLAVGDIIQLGDIEERYLVVAISADKVTLDHELPNDPEDSEYPQIGLKIYKVEILFNGSSEVLDETVIETVPFGKTSVNVTALRETKDLFQTNRQIINPDDFENSIDSIAFSTPNAKLKIIAKNPGKWCEDLRFAVGVPEDFVANGDYDNHTYRYVTTGITIDSLYEYAPQGTQIALVVYNENTEEVVETWLVDLTRGAKDDSGNSTFAENVINGNSSYIYVKVNDTNTAKCGSYTLTYDEENEKYVGNLIQLRNASDSEIQPDDLLNAYEVFSNKEEIDIDVIIANELDQGISARKLAVERQDCICFIGANKGDLVGKKSTDCVSNLVRWRKTGSANFDSRYCACVGSYKYMYDRENDEYFWCNIAGDIAGLRAQTNTNQDPWWASAGLTRGQIVDVVKLAFNPTKAQRDMMYKNSINPVVTFPGQGTVLYGQKTMQSMASSFDRINVVCLFNTVVRALEKMSRYQVMEFNDEYTRNRIIGMIRPYLQTVKGGRGIQDFMVICDTTNNTPDIISRNQLIVDCLIQPVFCAEFIHLRFTNLGVNSFSSVIS